jgi:hypothetical protein
MQPYMLTVMIDTETLDILRQMAKERGLICKGGRGAPKQLGSIAKLLKQIAQEEKSKQAEQE